MPGEAALAYPCARWLAAGRLGRLVRRGEAVATFESGAEPIWRGRLVVLVDRGTLGAAELLATVLRQAAGAQLVGESTFGWAGRRATAEAPGGGRLSYTDAFYAGPDGAPLLQPLRPDVDVGHQDAAAAGLSLGEEILRRGIETLRGAR